MPKKSLLLAFVLSALFGVNVLLCEIKGRGSSFHFFCINWIACQFVGCFVGFFNACLYLTDEPAYSLSSLLYMYWEPRACGDKGWFPAWLQNRDLLIPMISVLNESSAKVTLLTFVMSAAFCTVSPRQRGCFRKISGCSLRCCFPCSVIYPYHVVFLSPLICVSSWNTESSETSCAK